MRTRSALPLLLVLATLASPMFASAQTTTTTTTTGTVGNIAVSVNSITAPAPNHSRITAPDVNHGLNVFDCAQLADVTIEFRLASASGALLAGAQFDIWYGPLTGSCQSQSSRTIQNGACQFITHTTAVGQNFPTIVLPMSDLVHQPGDTTTTAPIVCDPNAPPNPTAASFNGVWFLRTDQALDRASNVTTFGAATLKTDFARPLAVTPNTANLTGDTSVQLNWSTSTAADADQLYYLVLARTGGCDLGIADGGVDAGVDASVDASTGDAGLDGGVDAAGDAGLDASVDGSVDGGDGGAAAPVDLVSGGYLPTVYNDTPPGTNVPPGWQVVAITAQGASGISLDPASLGLTKGPEAPDGSTPTGPSSATVVIVPQDQAFNTGAISTPVCVQRIPVYGLCDLLIAEGKRCPSGACSASPIGDHRRGSWLAIFLVSVVALATLARRFRRSK